MLTRSPSAGLGDEKFQYDFRAQVTAVTSNFASLESVDSHVAKLELADERITQIKIVLTAKCVWTAFARTPHLQGAFRLPL